MGEWEYAREAFRRATDLDPEYADAWAFLGEAQQQISGKETGSYSEVGLSELQRALQVDPNSILANFFMGLVLGAAEGLFSGTAFPRTSHCA